MRGGRKVAAEPAVTTPGGKLMPSMVVDPSAVLPHLLGGRYQRYATGVIRALRDEGGLSTDLFPHELHNVLLNAERHAGLQPQAGGQFASLLGHLILLLPVDEPHGAMSLARRHSLSYYDAGYLYLAQVKQLKLATKDKELIAAAPAAGVELFEPPEDEADDA